MPSPSRPATTAASPPEVLADPAASLATEWLETDGLGGFASSTVWDCATRRYHGLLIAWPEELPRRHLFVARLDATLRSADGRTRELFTIRWHDGRLAPRGDLLLDAFTLDPHPTWTWRIGADGGGEGGLALRRELLMPKGRAVALCRYTLTGGSARLELRPGLACREADALHFRNEALDPGVERIPGGFRVRPYPELPPVSFRVAGAAAGFAAEPRWLEGIDLGEERARGYDAVEDLWQPGVLEFELADGASAVVAVTVGEPVEAPDRLFESTLALRLQARDAARQRAGGRPGRARLDARADDFFQVAPSAGAGPEGRLGICAGYPWFGEWGRDTFLALPGLTLARGRVDQAARVLSGALEFLRDGLLPNIYGTSPAASHYGSVDAALWFARAVDLWRAAGGAATLFEREYAPALLEIATCYHDGLGRAGHGLGIRARDDGLLVAGREDLNATWMDAQLPSGPVTPRNGMPVEIEALWLALLDQCADLAGGVWARRRDRAFERFVELFWLPDGGGGGHLADRIRPDGTADPRIRPNMVLAAALRRGPWTPAIRAGVLAVAERDLLTPRGLRTLAPSDPDYRGRYEGDTASRDHAYHQGTAWPWLLGSQVELTLAVRGPAAVPGLRRLLDGFDAELDRAGLDHVSEVFDGDPPQRPGGTIAQAWSSAELLRAHYLLDVAEATAR